MHVIRSLENAALLRGFLDRFALKRNPRILLLVGCLVVHAQFVVELQCLDFLLFLQPLFLRVAWLWPQVVWDLEGSDLVGNLLLFGLEGLFEFEVLHRLFSRHPQEIKRHDILAKALSHKFDLVLILHQPEIASFDHFLLVLLCRHEYLLHCAAAPHAAFYAHSVALRASDQVSGIQRLQPCDELAIHAFRLQVLANPRDFDGLSGLVHVLDECRQPSLVLAEVRLADGALVLAFGEFCPAVDGEFELVLLQNHVFTQLGS